MTDNNSKVKKLYKEVTSVGSDFPFSEKEFGMRIQDENFAKQIYDFASNNLGAKLLGAPDEKSFLDSLGFNKTTSQPTDSVVQPINRDIATSLKPVEMPTKAEQESQIRARGQELMTNTISTPKDSVLPVGADRNVVNSTPKVSAEEVISNHVQPEVKGGVSEIGQDKIADAILSDNLVVESDEKLAQWHKDNDAFITEYESKLNNATENAHNLYSESFSPLQYLFDRKSKEDKDFINANSAKYNELIKQRDAIQRTKEIAETMKKYADFDKSVEIGEQMSSMVDKGELTEFDMEELRDISDETKRKEALTRMYNQGRISQDTFNKILDFGDTKDKSGLWYGMFKTGRLADFATLGMNEMARNLDILDVAQRFNEGLPVSEEEKTLLHVYNKLSELQSRDRSFGFNAGVGMQQSMQFVLESMLTGGVNAIGASAKQGGKALLKRIGQNAIRQAALTPVTPMMYNDYAERLTNMYINNDEVTGMDKAKALYKSYVGTFAERFSETLGGVVGEAKLLNRLLNTKTTRKILGNAFETMSKIADNPVYKTTADILATGGITDIPGEIASEYSGNIINSIFTLDAEGLSQIFDPEFLGQVALQSVMMGGMGHVISYTAGSTAAALENRKSKKELVNSIEQLSSTQFDNPTLESLKNDMIATINNNKIIGEDGTLESGDLYKFLSQMKAEITRDGNLNDRDAMRAVDNAVRTSLYRYGQNQAMMAIVESHVGEFLNDDGNVYEYTDPQGNNYFILSSTDDASVLINRATGDRVAMSKNSILDNSVTITKGEDWAFNEFVSNIDRWNQEEAVPYNDEQFFTPADKLDIGGVIVNVADYNPTTGKYIIINERGEQVEIDPNDEDVTPIYGTTQQTPQQTEETPIVEEEKVNEEQVAQPEQEVAQTEENPIETEVVENEIEYDDKGDPVWSKITAERAKQEIDGAFEEDEAKAFIADKIKAAEKAVKTAEKKKPKAQNIRDRKAEIEQIKTEREQAQSTLDYWNSVSQLYVTPQPTQEDVDEVPVAETEQVFKNTSDSILPEGVTPYTVGENIKQKYNDAPKTYGVEDTYTDAEGNNYKGRWVVVEADAVTPSHNANTLSSSEGFPVTDKGRNVNDNDYSNKAGVVETMAANYDARALDEPVIVSEGAIVSGNNRTISRQLSAQKGTDSKYKEALPSKAQMRGISAEDLGKFQNPTLVFELAEPVEYTTETFAKFNRPRSKTKSPVDMAIAIGKQDTSRLVGQVLSTIGEVDKLSELYQNQNKVAEIMKQVVESGIINQNEMPQFYSQEYGITDAGKDFIETLLIGSVINEDQIRILNSEGMKQYREKIVSAMLPIAKNMKFEDNIGNRLNTAIKYLKEARDAKTDLRGILLDNPIFDAKEYEDLTIFTALMLQRKPSEFRDFINNLNDRLSLGGENLFGEQETAQSVLEDYKQQNKLTDNERETIRLAEQTRNSATQSVYGGVQADGTNADNRGEGVDGSSISKTEKQSVENGNIEQSGYDNLDESIGNGETGRRGGESNDTGAESYQQPMGSTSDRGVSTNIGEGVPTEEARTTATEAIVETLKESGIEVKIEVETPIDQIENAEYHKVYHGTGAKFDKFDHSHMGEGEGNQAFGWGSYVTEVEGIGRTYAKDIARNGKRVYLDGNDITDLVPKVPSSIHSPSVYAAAFMLRYKDEARNAIQEHLNELNTTFGSISEQANPKLYNAYKQAIQTAEEAIKVIDNSKFEVKETTPTLYTIEIPDDNGSNYLNWSEVIEDKDLDVLLDKISEATKDDESFDFDEFAEQLQKLSDYSNILGEDLYFTLSRHGFKTNHKAASQLLSKIGFVGVKYPAQFRTGGRADGAKNYVIFNENDLQIKDRIEFMKTPNGTIYGWTVGGKIYLTKDGFNPDTPIHEYTHIWANAMKQKNPKGWASIKNLLKDTPVWNNVINDENYSNIRDNEDSVASEVLSRISGKKNAEKMEKEAQKMIDEAKGSIGKARTQELIKRMKEALNKFWSWVGIELFKIESFDSVEQVADRILYDLLNKTTLDISPNSQVELQIVTDAEQIAKLESSPKKTGYRNVVLNLDGTFGSPMASGLRSKGKDKVRTTSFEIGKWEQAEENPQLANEEGKITLVKPDGKSVADVDYNPYIHNRLDTVNAQFKQAWERPNLVYIETEVATTDLESGYKAEKAAKPVGVHKWNNGDLMLSRYDKPIRIVPWSEVADDWVERFKDRGVEFDIVPPALLPILTMRGVNILPPHKGMGKACNDAYAEWQKKPLKKKEGIITDEQIEQLNKQYGVNTQENQEQTAQADTKENVGRTTEQKQALFDKAKEIFGTTNNFKVAGYMLPDGSLLDFSGKWEGGPGDARYTDHRAIGSGLYEASETDSNYDTNMYDFINQGAIRLMPESAGIYVSQPLTEKQEDRLASYIYRNNGEVILEIIDNDGNSISYIEYNRRTSPEKVLSDISNYFEKGIEPVQPEIRFRLADGPMGARQHSEEVMRESIDKMAQDLGVNAEYVSDEKHLDKKGWYDPATGKVYVNLAAHETIDDAKATYLHEVVGHFGLRGLLKDKFEKVMNDVFNSLSKDVQADLLKKYKNDKEVAAEEYLSGMIESDIEPSLVEKILGFIREALRSMGINLDNYTNGDLEYLLWRSKNNLRENAGHVEAARWGAKNKETRYRSINRPAGYITNKMEMTDKDKILHSIQDRMRPVKKIMDEIINRGGTIDGVSDPYTQEFLATSRAAAEIEDFTNEKYEPLGKAIADAMKVFTEEFGMLAEDARKAVDDYLYARHAPERNKHICVNEIVEAGMKVATDKTLVNDAFKAEIRRMAEQLYDNQFRNGKNVISPKGLSKEQTKLAMVVLGKMNQETIEISRKKDDDGVLIANNRSGMTDAEAEGIMKNLYTPNTKAVLDEVSERVKDCTDFTLDKWLEYGLISDEEYLSYKNQYEYYIPLRGWDEKGEDIDYMAIPTKQFNAASNLVNLNRKAEGRISKAENPLAYIASLAQSACVTGNKNLIRQQAFRMVEKNEGLIDDLAVIENTYEIYDDNGNVVGYTKRRPSQALIDQGRVKAIRDRDYAWHKTGSELGAHRVPVLFNGVVHMLYFKGEIGALAATAINGTDRDTKNIVTQLSSQATRWISSNLTAKNIYFLGKNLVRDLGFGNFAYFVENGFGKTAKLNKYFMQAIRTAALDAMGADTSTFADSALYKEFKENGGQTGYVQMESINKLAKKMDKIINDASANRGIVAQQAVNAKDLLFETFDVLGKASENAMRFAIYKLERENGSSARQAAIRAKEITVNFNRQGKNTKGFSAVYAFFNPAVQGAYRYAKLAKENPARFMAITASLMAVKFGLAMMCELFSGSGDDDENKGESAYDRLSDYVKATNWVIPLGGWTEGGDDKFLCIPMPQSVRATTYLADLAVDAIYGRKNFGEVIKDYALFNVGEFMPFDIDAIDLTSDNPAATILQAVSPTLARPVIENVINRDFMGNPITKEPFVRSQDYIPQYQLAFQTTSPLLVGTSKLLNELAGGDEKRSAGIQISENGQVSKSAWSILDVNPAKVEHLFSGYFGGMFKPMLDTYDLMRSVVDEDVEMNVSSAVLVNQFIKGPTSKPGYKKFYELRDEAQTVKDIKNLYKEDYLNENYKPLNSNPFNYEIEVVYEAYNDLIKVYNENIMLIRNNADRVDDSSAQIKQLEKERDEIILQAANKYRDICDRRDKANKEQE